MTTTRTQPVRDGPGSFFTHRIKQLFERSVMDVAHMEAEAQLNGFLDRQAAKVKEDRAGQEHANTFEAFWRDSERRHREKEHKEHLWHRLRFHERMLQSHRESFREIVRRHKAGLAECEQALGITNAQGDDAA